MSVLGGIKRYLEDTQSKMEKEGDTFVLVLRRLPSLLATIEVSRRDALLRAGLRHAHHYTNVKGEAINRCPVPGRGEAVLSSSCFSRSVGPHFRAFHHE